VTAEHFGTTVDALLSERRMQSLSRPRQIAMFVARKVTGRSLPFIGRRMGDRDQTTILHGWRAVQSRSIPAMPAPSRRSNHRALTGRRPDG
jgi:chromosomal replication initiator protein